MNKFQFEITVLNANDSERINFLVDDETKWFDIRNKICNLNGDFYYLYASDEALKDNEYVLPMVRRLMNTDQKVYANVKRRAYLKHL